MEKVYTPKEVAEILKVSDQTVTEMLRSGSLTGVKAGKLWRIPERHLERYLNGNLTTDDCNTETE
jgi:excisionase family DNA binding protein